MSVMSKILYFMPVFKSFVNSKIDKLKYVRLFLFVQIFVPEDHPEHFNIEFKLKIFICILYSIPNLPESIVEKILLSRHYFSMNKCLHFYSMVTTIFINKIIRSGRGKIARINHR